MHNPTGKPLFHMVYVALITAFISVISPFVIPIPFSPVPLSLTTFILYLALYTLGTRYTFYSCLLYLLLGLIGLPVFAGFSGGIGRLAGPTGGYIVSYLFIPFIAGPFLSSSKSLNSSLKAKFFQGLGLSCGTFCCYILGTLWLSIQTEIPFCGALFTGVLPFLPGDLCKIVLALYIGPALRTRLQKAIS